jgi:hypothetical protein
MAQNLPYISVNMRTEEKTMNTMITKADIQKIRLELKRPNLDVLKKIGGREIRPSDLIAVRTSNL